MHATLVPGLLALAAAFIIGASQLFYIQALRRLSAVATGITVNFTVALVAALVCALSGGVERWPIAGVIWFALVGVFGPGTGRYLTYVSARHIGMARAMVLAQAQPLGTALFAILFLGERLTWGVGLGTVMIVWGSLLLARERTRGGRRAALRHYLFPVIAAMLFAVTPLFRKVGVALLPSASFGLLIAMFTAGVFQATLFPVLEGREAAGLGWSREGVRFAVIGACINAVGGLLFWTAIRLGDVIRVVPIRRLSALFVVIFSWVFFQRLERVTGRVLAGCLLSLAGATLIVVSR